MILNKISEQEENELEYSKKHEEVALLNEHLKQSIDVLNEELLKFKDILVEVKSQIIKNEYDFKFYQTQITNLKKEIDNLEHQLEENNQIIINLKDEYKGLVDQDKTILNNLNHITTECKQFETNLGYNQTEFEKGRVEKDNIEQEIEFITKE